MSWYKVNFGLIILVVIGMIGNMLVDFFGGGVVVKECGMNVKLCLVIDWDNVLLIKLVVDFEFDSFYDYVWYVEVIK